MDINALSQQEKNTDRFGLSRPFLRRLMDECYQSDIFETKHSQVNHRNNDHLAVEFS